MFFVVELFGIRRIIIFSVNLEFFRVGKYRKNRVSLHTIRISSDLSFPGIFRLRKALNWLKLKFSIQFLNLDHRKHRHFQKLWIQLDISRCFIRFLISLNFRTIEISKLTENIILRRIPKTSSRFQKFSILSDIFWEEFHPILPFVVVFN